MPILQNDKKQNIVFVAPFGLAQKTTIWARTLPLARHLVERGHCVTILIPPWDSPGDSGRCWLDQGVEVVNVALSGGLLLTIGRLLHQIYRRHPQIIHIVKPRAQAGIVQWLCWYGRWLGNHLLRRKGSYPLIFLDIDDWEQAWAEINHYPGLVAKFLAWQEEWGIRHADGVSAASRWLETRARDYAPQTPILYLPNGIENALAVGSTQRARQSTFRILYLSRYVEVEPEWLAEFWQALYERLPAVQFVIAGAPLQQGRDALFQQALTRQAPLTAQHIAWLGNVNRQQIEELYRAVDCAIFPAAPTVLQQAKCSVRLLTTLLHGVPVVASAVGEQANYGAAGAARLLAAEATPTQFAEAVSEVLRDPVAQKAMIERARQRLAKHYLWTKLAAELEGFYYEISAPK